MASMLVLTLIFLFNFSPTMAQPPEISPPTNPNELNNLETYIVHLNRPDGGILAHDPTDLDTWYKSFLPANTLASSNEESRMVYSYRNVITGFAAKLSPEEVKEMEKKDGFVLAYPQKIYSLHTTHSPNFLGLHQNLGFWKDSNFGKGVIIGVLDTGIAPNHPSFNDEGMPPPPTKWKGKCEFNTSTACNNKLIGARSFLDGLRRYIDDVAGQPTDEDGHGTHTASTAAGNFVRGANVLGNANGTAAGIAPLAHLAMYKVCSPFCVSSDIIAGIDAAVEDGVDVLSISLGGFGDPFYDDPVAVGALGAIKKGIFVSCSAGNDGPINASVSNDAPWLLTVGASTIDRTLQATAKLGSGDEYDGESAFQPSNFSSSTLLPLVYAGSTNASNRNAAFCGLGSFNNTDIKGKVVVCETGGSGGFGLIRKGQRVKDAGGAAMILVNQELEGYSTTAEAHVLPAIHVNYIAGQSIKKYINSTATPTATILFKGTVIGVTNAPMISSFSSRGPSINSPGILKPDIIGPGVSILAAWPFSLKNMTDIQLTFNMLSGTSMSCPHLSGVAALLKSTHPNWSPAAIKSAIMTTADLQNLDNKPIKDERLLVADIFAIGSGHVNPSRSNDPGLVYDIKFDDYIPYLCGLNYTNRQVGVLLNRRVNCTEESSSIPEAQLNYPSFSISLGSSAQTYSRTVTNVGEANSTYTVKIVPPPGVAVVVTPETLEFSEVNQKMKFEVSFNRIGGGVSTQYVQGFLTWASGKHIVRSPISVKLE